MQGTVQNGNKLKKLHGKNRSLYLQVVIEASLLLYVHHGHPLVADEIIYYCPSTPNLPLYWIVMFNKYFSFFIFWFLWLLMLFGFGND